jgi:hypothetical protein
MGWLSTIGAINMGSTDGFSTGLISSFFFSSVGGLGGSISSSRIF